jgi:hypothetical protein
LKQGRVRKITVSLKEGRFSGEKHRKWSIPFHDLRIAFEDVTLKLQPLLEGKLRIQFIGIAELKTLDVAGPELNAVLNKQSGELRRVRVEFAKGEIRLRWLGRPRLEVDAQLRPVADIDNEQSDNLWLQVKRLSVGYLTVPGSLVQWRLRSLLPLLKPDPTVGIVKLGTIYMEGNHLRAGTEERGLGRRSEKSTVGRSMRGPE